MLRSISWTLVLVVICGFSYVAIRRQIKVPKMRTGSIHMVQEHGDLPLHFFVVGDTGSGDDNQMAVAAAMEKRCQEVPQVDGLMLLGDQFYMKGVSSVDDLQWVDKIEKPYGSPCLKKTSIYPLFGNHDYAGNREAYVGYSRTHERWKMPHRFYSARFGDVVQFVGLDSNFADFCFMPEVCVVDFMLKELHNPMRWNIIMAHHPLVSASQKGGSHEGKTLYGKFFQWAACDKADMWLAGHAHHMEHRKLERCASQLFVSGGGGGDLEDVQADGEGVKFASAQFGFLELEIHREKISARFWNRESKIVYETEWKKD